MQCILCGHKNTGGVIYCQGCGQKLDMTADEIQHYYAQKARTEKRQEAEYHAFRLLVFSVVFLLIAITLKVMAGDIPENTSYVPSATKRTDFTRVDYDPNPPIREILIPLEEKRK